MLFVSYQMAGFSHQFVSIVFVSNFSLFNLIRYDCSVSLIENQTIVTFNLSKASFLFVN